MSQGYFRVDGYAEFLRCDNTGGGESPPGRGGAIFNGETGSILFRGGVRIEETYLTVRSVVMAGKCLTAGEHCHVSELTHTWENIRWPNRCGAFNNFHTVAIGHGVESGVSQLVFCRGPRLGTFPHLPILLTSLPSRFSSLLAAKMSALTNSELSIYQVMLGR